MSHYKISRHTLRLNYADSLSLFNCRNKPNFLSDYSVLLYFFDTTLDL